MLDAKGRKSNARRRLLAAMLPFLLAFAVGTAALSSTDRPRDELEPVLDPCLDVVVTPSAAAVMLGRSGMEMVSVPTNPIMPFTSVTCSAHLSPENSFIRGLLLTVSNEEGLAAVHSVLGSQQSSTEPIENWHKYVRETWPQASFEFLDLNERELVAVVMDHPRSDAVIGSYRGAVLSRPLPTVIEDVSP